MPDDLTPAAGLCSGELIGEFAQRKGGNGNSMPIGEQPEVLTRNPPRSDSDRGESGLTLRFLFLISRKKSAVVERSTEASGDQDEVVLGGESSPPYPPGLLAHCLRVYGTMPWRNFLLIRFN